MDAFLVCLSTLGPGMSIAYTQFLVAAKRISPATFAIGKASQSTPASKACFVEFGNQRGVFLSPPVRTCTH